MKNSVRPADCPYVANFNVAIPWDAANMINVKVCIMVVLTELYPFIPFSLTLIVCQGHSLVAWFYLKIACSYLIELKLCKIVAYVK